MPFQVAVTLKDENKVKSFKWPLLMNLLYRFSLEQMDKPPNIFANCTRPCVYLGLTRFFIAL